MVKPTVIRAQQEEHEVRREAPEFPTESPIDSVTVLYGTLYYNNPAKPNFQ